MVTQLIFDHALRIRLKAEVSDTPPSEGDTTAVATPDAVSLVEPSAPQSSAEPPHGGISEDETMHSSTGSLKRGAPKGKQKSKGGTGMRYKSAPGGDDKTSNLVGRLNNLVTSDVANIQRASDFPLVRELIIEDEFVTGGC